MWNLVTTCKSITVPDDANCAGVDVTAADAETTCETTDDAAGTPAKCVWDSGNQGSCKHRY